MEEKASAYSQIGCHGRRDRDSDLGAGWAVGARLFKVNDEIGLPEVIDRIINGELGDDFNPV